MNKSILIVTCDFLVLAAMSLSTGVAENGTSSGPAGVSSPASRLVEMIDREMTLHEEVKQQKDELEKRLEEYRENALQDKKRIASREAELRQIQDELADAIAKADAEREASRQHTERLVQEKATAEAQFAEEMNKADALLETTRRESAEKLAENAEKLAKANEENVEVYKKLTVANEEKAEIGNELAQAKIEIGQRDNAISNFETALEQADKAKVEIEAKLIQTKNEADERLKQAKAEAEDKLAQTKNEADERLRKTENDLSAVRQDLDAERSKRHDTEIQLTQTESALTQKQAALERTQNELSQKQAVLESTQGELVRIGAEKAETDSRLQETVNRLGVAEETIVQNKNMIDEKDKQILDREIDLEAAKNEIAELKKQVRKLEIESRNSAQTKYRESALELWLHLVNERMLSTYTLDETFFLPAVKLGEKNYIVSAFRPVTGLTNNSGFTKVPELSYKVRLPQTADSWIHLTSNAVCLNEDPRVCLFDADAIAGGATPLEPLTFNQLREQGLDGLTLFKSRTFSKESADITTRCSLSMDDGSNYMYIRNSNRSSSELRAEVGDIVLSKQGRFVGVVVQVFSADTWQTSTAICFVFPARIDMGKAFALPITKTPAEMYFFDFVTRQNKLREKTEKLDKEVKE